MRLHIAFLLIAVPNRNKPFCSVWIALLIAAWNRDKLFLKKQIGFNFLETQKSAYEQSEKPFP